MDKIIIIMNKIWKLGREYLFSSTAALLSLSLIILFSCGKDKHDHVTSQPLIKVTQQDGKTTATYGDELALLIQKGDFEKIRTMVCGKDGCSDELQTYKNELTLNALVTLTNTLILFKKLDGALSTACGLLREQLGGICGAPAIGSSPVVRIDTKQTNVIDTLLGLVGLKREEITTLMQEVSVATSNYIEKGDKNFVMKITVPFVAKIGNLINVRFNAGTELRWDLITILGSVSQLVSALFNVINAHDWMLDIQAIITNASRLLEDLQGDIPGFLRRLPGTLGINEAPNFLRFVQGGETYWKAIPSNISRALTWASDGLDYFFKNPCAQNDPNLVCWNKDKMALRFNLDSQYQNKFMGEDATGELKLPAGFSDKTADQIVSVLKDGGKKFNCQEQNNWVNIVGADGEFDIIKIVNAILSISGGAITEVSGIPNFLRINVCKIMGVKDANPVPLRDLILPAELKYDNGKWVYEEQAGTQFAIEIEAPRNFYYRAITAGNTENNKLYDKGVTEDPSNFLVITNKFYEDNIDSSFPFVRSITYAGSATEFYAEVITQLGNIPIWKLYVAQGIKWKRFDFGLFASESVEKLIEKVLNWREIPQLSKELIKELIKEVLIGKISPLIPNSVGVPDKTLALIVYKDWVKKWYVSRGDGDRFKDVYRDGKSLSIARDWLEPLTTYLMGITTHWFSKYPDDVMPASIGELLGIGLKNIPYILFRDKNGMVLNGAIDIDNCSIIVEYAKTLSGAVKSGEIDKVKYDMYMSFVLAPFVIERVNGYTYETYIKKYRLEEEVELQPSNTKYLDGCELTGEKIFQQDFDLTQLRHDAPQWKEATNQIANDLIALLVFGLRARSVLK